MNVIFASAFKTLLWITLPVIAIFGLLMSPKAAIITLALGYFGFLLYAFITAPATKTSDHPANPFD
ncbi:MAG: hypothetical protein IE928_09715 [Gammaproteobacteria bacterium]|nr:hypothetical protein [Gammaproteobacteria bacterium]